MIATTVLTLIAIMAIAMRMPTSCPRVSVGGAGGIGREERDDSAGVRRAAAALVGAGAASRTGRSIDASLSGAGGAQGCDWRRAGDGVRSVVYGALGATAGADAAATDDDIDGACAGAITGCVTGSRATAGG